MRTGLLIITLTAVSLSAASQALPSYWVQFPQPETLHVIDTAALPKLSDGDPGAHIGSYAFSLMSLSGLLAKANREGAATGMIWLTLPGNASYARWLKETVRLTGPKAVDVNDPAELIRDYAEAGIVKGYILYRADTAERKGGHTSPVDEDGYNQSANVATSLAAVLDAIVVEEQAEGTFQAMGLKRLLDVRDKTEAWCFDTYRDHFSRKLVHMLDPRYPHMRDYCIGTESIVVYGVSPFTDRLLAWLEPNSPAMGWNAGDEYSMTSQLSRYGHFTTASNWIMNLPAISSAVAGEDVPWEGLRMNQSASFDPLAMEWREDTHFTSFLMSDGNNIQWFMGDFCDSKSYWEAPSRGSFPMGWTVPAAGLAQCAAPTLAYLNATATPNDYFMLHDVGYFYWDQYARERENREAVMAAKVAMDSERMSLLGVRVLNPLVIDWKSEESMAAYRLLAEKAPDLAGIMVIAYSPYNAPKGEVLWVENSQGHPIPVVGARYALWAGLSKKFPLNGPPRLVAKYISEAPYAGAPSSEAYFDWTIVHAWSSFTKAAPDDDSLLAEEPDPARPEDTFIGLEPVKWCVDQLAPHVEVVSAGEMLWRMRLHMKPRGTLEAMSGLLETPESAAAYQAWLADTPLDTPARVKAAFERLKGLRR